jgi:WD40 repeat protein
MRLRLRSPRRTWVLVGGLWLAGCGVIWWVLPNGPRLVVPEPGGHYDFTLDSRFIGGQDFTPEDRARIDAGGIVSAETDAANGPHIIRNITDGHGSTVYYSPHHTQVEFAPDGREILVEEHGPDGRKNFIVDVKSGREFNLPVREDGLVGWNHFTQDGRFIVYDRHGAGVSELTWFDRIAKRVVSTIPDAEFDRISATGRWTKSNVPVIQVRESASDRVMFDLSHLGNARVDAFLPNEDFLVVERGDAREIVDASNPAVRIPIKNCDFYMQSDSETLFVSESVIGGARVTQWNLRTGQIVNSRKYTGVNTADRGPAFWASPIRSRMLFRSQTCNQSVVHRYLWRIPVLSRFARGADRDFIVVNVETGKVETRIPVPDSGDARLSPDGNTLMVKLHDGTLEFWDLPLRESRLWFACVAAMWLACLIWIIRRRLAKFSLDKRSW